MSLAPVAHADVPTGPAVPTRDVLADCEWQQQGLPSSNAAVVVVGGSGVAVGEVPTSTSMTCEAIGWYTGTVNTATQVTAGGVSVVAFRFETLSEPFTVCTSAVARYADGTEITKPRTCQTFVGSI